MKRGRREVGRRGGRNRGFVDGLVWIRLVSRRARGSKGKDGYGSGRRRRSRRRTKIKTHHLPKAAPPLVALEHLQASTPSLVRFGRH